MLPFAEDETIEALERNIAAAGSVTDMLARGMTAADISEQLLAGLGGQDTGFQLTPRWVAFGAVAGCGVCDEQRQRQQVAGDGSALKGRCWQSGRDAGAVLVFSLPRVQRIDCGACRCPGCCCRCARKYIPCEPVYVLFCINQLVILLGARLLLTLCLRVSIIVPQVRPLRAV